MRHSFYLPAAAALLLGGTAFGHSIRPASNGSVYASAAQLRARVAHPHNSLAYSALPTGAKGPALLMIRRDASGDVEIHDKRADVLVARKGHARIIIGGTVSGDHRIAPGEWRGGKITGGTSHDFAPGDVVWIPAGLPHQIVVTSKSFTYLALKYPAPAQTKTQDRPY
jgi:mannose-6-phosphate isomerase-like protein (cupin superfamily)